MRDFLNRKRLSYFFLQEIPDLFSYHKNSNMQLYIRRCLIICMCKILVQNLIIKDILKKKNDVHWISVWTIGPILYVSDHKQRNYWSLKVVKPYLNSAIVTKHLLACAVRASSMHMSICAFEFLTAKQETRPWYSTNQKSGQ